MSQPSMPPQVTEEPAAEPSLSAYESAFAAMVLAALTAWLAGVMAAVLAGFVRFGLAPDPTAVFSREPIWVASVDRFMESLADLARLGWESAGTDLGVRTPFDLRNPIIQDQLSRTRNLLVRVNDEVYKDVINALNKAIAQGLDVRGQEAAVRDVLDINGSENWPARARTIAVTEVNRAWNFGVLAHGLTVQQDLRLQVLKRWDSKDDTRVRAAHEAADGQTVPISQPFIVDFEPLMAPLDPSGSPSNVINCIPGSARISASGVQGGFRYLYEGELIQVLLRSGDRLSVSPNHPILTECGWILASQLKQGENLVKAAHSDSRLTSLGISPDVKTEPALASEIFDALLKAGIAQRIVGLPMNFHGDGSNSDVDVVLVDGELSFGVDASIAEQFDQICLTFANESDASGGALHQLLMGSLHPTNGVMSLANLLNAGFGSHSEPLGSFGLTLGSEFDSSSLESRPESLSGNSGILGDRLQGFAGLVSLDEVVEVRNELFSGHLYTFQTASGVYVADGSVSHNCRCKARLRRMP